MPPQTSSRGKLVGILAWGSRGTVPEPLLRAKELLTVMAVEEVQSFFFRGVVSDRLTML